MALTHFLSELSDKTRRLGFASAVAQSLILTDKEGTSLQVALAVRL